MVYNNSKTCTESDIEFQLVFTDNYPDKVVIFKGDNCKYGRFRLSPEENPTEEYALMTNGSLYVPNLYDTPVVLEPGTFCLETVVEPDGRGDTLSAFLCFPDPDPTPWTKIGSTIYCTGCSLSVPFLLTTAVIFAVVSELKNLRGKVITQLTFGLACTFVFLSIVQTQKPDELPQSFCLALAFSLQFCILLSFFWMNVMCYHTWWKTRLGSKSDPTSEAMEKKRFRYYLLYGWSVPALIVIAAVLTNTSSSLPSYLTPNLGTSSCWFKTDFAAAIYLYGPLGAVLFFNLVFFSLTSSKMYREQERSAETGEENGPVCRKLMEKQNWTLCKRILAMIYVTGITWIPDVTSLAVEAPFKLWILAFLLNTLQGPVLFYLFVWGNKKERRLTVERLVKCRTKKQIPAIVEMTPREEPLDDEPPADAALIKRNGFEERNEQHNPECPDYAALTLSIREPSVNSHMI